MTAAADPFGVWLEQARIPEHRLTPPQRGLLQAAFAFRQDQGDDYYANRLLGHFLLHCHSGLKVAQVARLAGCSRQTASQQQALSAKEAIRQARHRMDGRPYGKLLPRFAGPIAAYVFAQGMRPITIDDGIEIATTWAKDEISGDVNTGRVPLTVQSFSQLHDYVDANGYGGAFDWPCLPSEQRDDAYQQAFADFWNTVQNRVNEWIASGQMRAELTRSRGST